MWEDFIEDRIVPMALIPTGTMKAILDKRYSFPIKILCIIYSPLFFVYAFFTVLFYGIKRITKEANRKSI